MRHPSDTRAMRASLALESMDALAEGQGVGLLSRWGLPAWVRIPQVSFCQHAVAQWHHTARTVQT